MMLVIRHLARNLIVVSATLSLAAPAHAWSGPGHQLTGAVADKLLIGGHAAAKVKALLGFPLQTAATWADCVKDVAITPDGPKYKPLPQYHQFCKAFETPAGIAEMEAYVGRNADACHPAPDEEICHKQYHYTDVDILRPAYGATFAGANDHDVVHAIGAALAVLQGQPSPAPFNFASKREALLVLAHLVGDVHQPLHVGAIYFDDNGEPVDPDSAGVDPKATFTRGGNFLKDGSKNFHSEWDTIPTTGKAFKPSALASKASHVAATPGALTEWPAAWATDTLGQAGLAFRGLSFGPRVMSHGTPHWAIISTNAGTYNTAKTKLQAAQIAKGGARLAALLKAVWP